MANEFTTTYRHIVALLRASFPGDTIRYGKARPGDSSGFVIRHISGRNITYTGAHPLMADQVWRVLRFDSVDEIGEMEGDAELMDQVLHATHSVSGGREVFSMTREQEIVFTEPASKTGSERHYMGWSYRVYPRATTP